MTKLDGRTALVTGGSRGIGRAVVETLARAGARVAFVYQSNAQAADQLVAELAGQELSVAAHPVDVRNKEAADEIVGKLVEGWGKIDILVNNAGIVRDVERAMAGCPGHESDERLQFLPGRHAADDVRALRSHREHVERGGGIRK
jgi:NAD(P)-dependent dehydrogenase (short-subunit alcohol dehydrogenase family)